MTQIPIQNHNHDQLNNYCQLDYNQKGKLVERIGKELLQFHAFGTVEITSKALQKVEGDTVINIEIPRITKKQITADYKSGGCSKGYNDLCIDIEYFTKKDIPKIVNGTNLGWLYTTVSDLLIVVVPKTKKLFSISWNGKIQRQLIRSYSLFTDRIEPLPSWVTLDLIKIDKYKNTKVLRIDLDQLAEQFPNLVIEYDLVRIDTYEEELEAYFQELEEL